MEMLVQSCILSSNAPALPEPDCSISSRALQERSTNRRHDYSEGSSWKCSPPAKNMYLDQLSGYFTGNIADQLHDDKSEGQIEFETKRLLHKVRNCEKYKKYRERQPRNAKEKLQKWPDHLEEAFFRGLVRWPPMGRRKLMLDGQLRGRNELVADSILRDTGDLRKRKQVSSHIQVLKKLFTDQPQILVYMSKEDLSQKRSRGEGLRGGHFRHRHAPHSRYGHSRGGSSLYQSLGQLPSSLALAELQSIEESPYTVTNFGMFVEVAKQQVHVHDFTKLHNNSRLADLNVADTTSWHKQYPELNFHRTDELENHHVIVCDASIKVMTKDRPAGAELGIDFDLCSQVDLSVYDYLECRTRFFGNGKPADQIEGSRGQERRVKQTRTRAEYYAQHGGLVRVKFGSNFWAHQMRKLGDLLTKAAGQEEQSARTKYETVVRTELQYMTASQEIYGVNDGEFKCLLIILWRFSQTRSSHEQGRMSWRVVNFGQKRRKRHIKEELEEIKNAKALIPAGDSMMPMVSIPDSSHAMYSALPLDFDQAFVQPQPQLGLDTLALEGIAPDFSNPSSATDFSQPRSLPSLSHGQDTVVSQTHGFHDPNDFDFHGGHLTISGCLEPAIDLATYEAYSANTHAMNLPSLASMAGADANTHSLDPSFNDLALSVSMPANCYATKPSWHHPSLISQLEDAAEQFNMGDLMAHAGTHTGAEDLTGHGVLGGPMEGLWKLGSTFGEDTGMGAVVGDGSGRKDSAAGPHVGCSVMDLIEREREG